jgi:hypothetical protein
MTPVPSAQQQARAAIKKYGGVRKAAQALRINYAVLSLLATGKRTSASPRTLRALGLRRQIELYQIREAQS